MLTLTACAGAGDWKYEDLPGDYAVWRINSQEIPLVCVDDDGLTAEPVVEGYVGRRLVYADPAELVQADDTAAAHAQERRLVRERVVPLILSIAVDIVGVEIVPETEAGHLRRVLMYCRQNH